jgi:hypothetical protein
MLFDLFSHFIDLLYDFLVRHLVEVRVRVRLLQMMVLLLRRRHCKLELRLRTPLQII